eukprot:TRINITY_DN4718_c0_g1_i11.p1 TRINITY_DN4718_c0_g1~~TRINITY_DN4718_c0_g1_i11.p1  ORF type:complete len:185 (-),score=-1.23 TRINITY_DN4718_c0_g1_i11:87-641(-)
MLRKNAERQSKHGFQRIQRIVVRTALCDRSFVSSVTAMRFIFCIIRSGYAGLFMQPKILLQKNLYLEKLHTYNIVSLWIQMADYVHTENVLQRQLLYFWWFQFSNDNSYFYVFWNIFWITRIMVCVFEYQFLGVVCCAERILVNTVDIQRSFGYKTISQESYSSQIFFCQKYLCGISNMFLLAF